jgi:hypothetical protein
LSDAKDAEEDSFGEIIMLNADARDKGMGKLLANKPNLDEDDV